jgi:tetratricopeptide (TPR) repeat protein
VREALTGRPGNDFPDRGFDFVGIEDDFIGEFALHRVFGVLSQREYTMRMTLTQPQKKTRRQILEDFVAAKPTDAFARYGLAMECANSGDAAAADEHFKALLASHPEYVAGYFQFGQFLAKSGRIEEARSTLNTGIATAERTGDEHARSEMLAALAELG